VYYLNSSLFIVGGKDSYLPALLEVMDITEIPAELGGELQDAPWCGPFLDKYGSSEAQINAKVAEMEAQLNGGIEDVVMKGQPSSAVDSPTTDSSSLEELS
jgi:hypothetical protein